MTSELYAFRISTFSEEIEQRVPTLADEVERYDTIPLVIARTDEHRSREIAALPGILEVCPCIEAQRRIVWSIDRLLRVISANRETLLINGVGNAYPGVHAQPPPYPRLCFSPPPPRIEFDPEVQLQTRACVVGALNLSIEEKPPRPYHAGDPVNVATRAAASVIPCVIAAGNHIPPDVDQPTIAGWPEAPWTISVGATQDDEGKLLAAYSRIGRDETSGPTVVAWGRDDLTMDEGTSYAAPRVSLELALLSAFWTTLRHAYDRVQGNVREGIPLTGVVYVDLNIMRGRGDEHGFKVSDLVPPEQPLPALPAAAIDEQALAGAIRLLNDYDLGLALPTPAILRRMLLASARPVPGASRESVGAGFISRQTTLAYLARFSGADLAALAAPRRVESQIVTDLTALRLVDRDTLPPLVDAWSLSMLRWAIDLENFSPTNDPDAIQIAPA